MRQTAKQLIVLAVVGILAAAASASPADEIDDYLRAEMEKRHVPGMSLAVVKDGQLVKSAGYGLANVELNVPAQPESVFKIGSVSKQFLATGIMLLVQDGKLAVDDKITSFLDAPPETWSEITVRHLLTHTSGLPREAPGFVQLKVQSEADVIKSAYPVKLLFEPGTQFRYCNLGYFTLAEIIHKVSGKPWGDFLKERVFDPLQMHATRVTTMSEIVPARASGYYFRRGGLANDEVFLAVRPSGAFLSSVLDMAKWDAALYGDTILKEATRTAMWTPVTLNDGTPQPYGFGWQVLSPGGKRAVRHGGSLGGFRAEFIRFLDEKLSVIILTNGGGALPGVWSLQVAKHYIADLSLQPAAAGAD
ncbi:MAG: serine hydrolase domain-containing protein [Pirellulales bacterium]